MELSYALPQAGHWATPAIQIRVAREAEVHGYHGLWTFQRLLYPLNPRNAYPPLPDQPWPSYMESSQDPIVSLAYIAAVTSRIRLGTAGLIMPFYSPIVLARQITTLDQLSGGRVDLGLGIGWSIDEYEAVGVPYARRGRRADEFLRCLKTIWTGDEVEFAGEFYRLPRCRVLPRPIQRPHPPLIMGGYSPVIMQRVVALADGFVGGNTPLNRIRPLVAALKTAAAAAGRDLSSLRIVSRGSYAVFDAPQGPDRRPLWGTIQEIRDDIARYAEAGLTELFLDPNSSPELLAMGANAQAALSHTLRVLETLAPGS